MRKLFGCILVIGAFFQPGAPAASVSVCDDASLRAAIAQGGIVTFGCSGTIVLTQAITVANNVILDGTGAQVTLSGDDKTRLFEVSPNVEFELRSLRLTRGLAAFGGAISNGGGMLILKGVMVSSNTAANPFNRSLPCAGGGIYSSAGGIIATECTFSSNSVYAANGYYVKTPARGAALSIDGGLLQLSNCVFESNHAEGFAGSGPVSPGSPISFGADALGAAIYNSGTTIAQRCRFLGNQAFGGAGVGGSPILGSLSGSTGGFVSGGVIYNLGAIQLDQCTFMDNTASAGRGGNGANANSLMAAGGSGGGGGFLYGAIILNAGLLSVANCTFAANAGHGGNGGTAGNGLEGGAGGWGGSGGLAFGGAIFTTNAAAAFLTNCTIVGNTLIAGDGQPGAAGSSCVLSGCNGGNGGRGGSGGTAAGAGLYLLSSTSAVVHCTVDDNSVRAGTNGVGGAGGTGRFPGHGGTAGPGGTPGAAQDGALSVGGGNVQAANSIFSRSQGSTNCSGQLLDLGVNICSDQSSCFTNAASMKGVDPGLQSLADNGGPTMTLALLDTSPAHNRGSNTFAPALDQRGVPRPQGKICDVGAFELGHLISEKASDAGRIRYAAAPGTAWRLQSRVNWGDWRDLGGSTADTDGYSRYGPLPVTNHVEIFRTSSP